MSEHRPSPEKLLKRVQEEERKGKRGQLKIYLGAAPGVGKTHEMLQDALAERAKGLDIVIGIVESHGRKEIESMMTNFEMLPRQEVDYHSRKLLEFDLDAALKRHPGLILIDEMAHTNAPGLRHTKRWQDIKELLDRGIDVYTTLNIQHIESLNDDVAQIIHAPIKETVPDSMLELADTIELVDIPPEELLQRLKEGKVYVPQQAELAIEHFFRKGNLAALRELALRTAAARVGTDVLLYRQGQGIKFIWPTKDKILVCVGPGPESLKLIRAARRIVSSLRAEWIAVYVETPRDKISEEKRNSAIQNLRLAEQLGAETRVLTGFDIVKEILAFAREQNVTEIMIWKYIHRRWHGWFFRSLADEIVRQSREIDVYIMTGERDGTKRPKPVPTKSPTEWNIYGFSVGIILVATGLNFLIDPVLGDSNTIMIYLLGITIVALFGRIGPSIVASVLSVVGFDFFFASSSYTFVVQDSQQLITLIVMLIVAFAISQLTILTRRQAESSGISERQTSSLYALSKQLASTRGVDKLLETALPHIADLFNSEVIALLPEKNHLVVQASAKTTDHSLNTKEKSVAQWVYELGQMAGLGTDTLPFSDALYVPLIASEGTIGVLKLRPIHSKQLFTPEEMRLLEACAKQIAFAIEADHLQAKITTDNAQQPPPH